MDTRTREVTYPAGAGYRLRVIGLLHECGHILCDGKYDYFDDAVELLHEECEAWHRGWRLAARLGVRVSRRAYTAERNSRISGYVYTLAGVQAD